MVVYKIVNDVNGKMYIGQTIQSIESRMSEHIDSAKKGSMNSIHQAIRQYGAEHFHIEVVTTATTREQLYQLEAYYVDLWNTVEQGYNDIGGGRFGSNNPMNYAKVKERHDKVMRSEEVRSKISSTLKKYYRENHDSPAEVEHRRKLSEQKRALYASAKGEEVKAKQRASFKFTPEHFQALRESKYKPVYCVDREGSVIAKFNSVKAGAQWWYHDRGFQYYKPPLENYIKKSFDQDIFIDNIHWYYGEPCAESIES